MLANNVNPYFNRDEICAALVGREMRFLSKKSFRGLSWPRRSSLSFWRKPNRGSAAMAVAAAVAESAKAVYWALEEGMVFDCEPGVESGT